MSRILNKTKCYLVGNLEYTEDAYDWRAIYTKDLESLGIKCFDPNKNHFLNQSSETEEDRVNLKNMRDQGEWQYVSDYMKGVIRRDLRFIDLSTFIIGNIEPDRPTFGTIHEIVMASIQKKPILLTIKDKSQFPLWLAGLIDMSLVFEKWEHLFGYLNKINEGKIFADPKYWKVLVEDFR
jgi:nucleoside 2-deoxyribosyltransferase